jgi:hypothetical protein
MPANNGCTKFFLNFLGCWTIGVLRILDLSENFLPFRMVRETLSFTFAFFLAFFFSLSFDQILLRFIPGPFFIIFHYNFSSNTAAWASNNIITPTLSSFSKYNPSGRIQYITAGFPIYYSSNYTLPLGQVASDGVTNIASCSSGYFHVRPFSPTHSASNAYLNFQCFKTENTSTSVFFQLTLQYRQAVNGSWVSFSNETNTGPSYLNLNVRGKDWGLTSSTSASFRYPSALLGTVAPLYIGVIINYTDNPAQSITYNTSWLDCF